LWILLGIRLRSRRQVQLARHHPSRKKNLNDFLPRQGTVQPERLRAQIVLWAEEEVRLGALPPKSTSILEAVLYRGELPRGDAAGVVGASDRHARRIVSALIERGVLMADSARAPLRLVFPATLASRWMPGLFPEKPDEEIK